jgi:hypothetical protein
MTLTEANRSTRCRLSETNPTCTGLGLNYGFYGQKPAFNLPSHHGQAHVHN